MAATHSFCALMAGALVIFTGCASEPNLDADGAVRDGGAPDASMADTGADNGADAQVPSDAGAVVDAGMPDRGTSDGAVADADAGNEDGGQLVDAGTDAGCAGLMCGATCCTDPSSTVELCCPSEGLCGVLVSGSICVCTDGCP